MQMAKKRKKKQSGIVPIVVIIVCLVVVVGSLMAQKLIKDGGWMDTGSTASTGGSTVLSLDQTEITLYVSYSTTLNVSPDGTEVQWSSDNDDIATVNEKGVVMAVAPGTATIRAEGGGSSVSCVVTVIALPVVQVTNTAGTKIDEGLLQTLKDLTAQKPLNISIYYYDLSSGATIEYNSGKKYSAGSVVKAPYCRWLISSGTDLQEPLTFTAKDILEGAGSIKDSPEGTVFTIQQLIEKAIVESDNTAYNMLTKRFGFEGYTGYVKSMGVSASQSSSNLFGSMSAAGAAVLFTDIYQWSQNNPEQGKLLIDYMCNTNYRKMISSVTDVPVAHKYGFNNGTGGFHDAAIVYSDRPYVLTIFTNLDPDKSDTVPYIQNVASCLNSINQAQ